MGADRAILVETADEPDPLSGARALLEIVNRENPELVILGKQAIDNDNAQTGQMLATLWGRPQATFASKLEFSGGSVRVTREVDAGLDVIEVDLPAVITADLRLNEPRYVKLPDIMKAKKKPLDTIPWADLALPDSPAIAAVNFEPPAARRARHHGGRRRRTRRRPEGQRTAVMAKVLLIAEHDGENLNPNTAKCIACAAEFRVRRSMLRCSPHRRATSRPKPRAWSR